MAEAKQALLRLPVGGHEQPQDQSGNGEHARVSRHVLPLPVRLAHVQVDLNLARPDWPARLRQAAQESAQIGTALHLALWLTNQAEAELDAVRRELDTARPNISLFLVFHSGETAVAEKWIRLAREKLSSYAPNTLFAAGHRPFFNELNRNRPAKDSAALPCFPIAPQVRRDRIARARVLSPADQLL